MTEYAMTISGLALRLAACAFFAGNVWAQLPDGPGKEETQRVCKGCHELERSLSPRQDRDGWQQTVDKMVALGAEVTAKDYNLILDYLAKNYPGEEIPKLNVNTATAIELESRLTLARSQAAALIEYRNKHGAFKSIDDLKKVPGVDAAKIEAKKDRITF
jgi:competence protein ComEA